MICKCFPPHERGVTFEALYSKCLQLVTNRIHKTENIDQIRLEVRSDICWPFNADRLTWFAVDDDHTAIVSKVKTELNSTRDLKQPISTHSTVGYVAMVKQMVDIGDFYDFNTPKNIDLSFSFFKRLSNVQATVPSKCWSQPS